MLYVGGTAEHTLAVLSLRVHSGGGVLVQVWDAWLIVWSVPDKTGSSCSSAETAWSVRAAKGNMGCSGISVEACCTDWKLCSSANGEMTEFRWIELGGSVSLVWRTWEQFSLEQSTQCRVQVMKGVLKTSFSRRDKQGKTLHMLCSPNKSKFFFVNFPMSLLLNTLKFAW